MFLSLYTAVILSSSVLIYLSIYVCPQIFAAATASCSAWRSVFTHKIYACRLRVYALYFSQHCAGVTNMSQRYNLSPTVKIGPMFPTSRLRSSSAIQMTAD